MIPKDAKKIQTNIVAEGEVTGHYHKVMGGEVLGKDDKIFARSEGQMIIKHQEHKPIPFSGEREIFRVQEFQHLEEEVQQARD